MSILTNESNPHEYLGDGAYAELVSPFIMRVFTTNGIETTNEVFLEPDMLHSLRMFIEQTPEAERFK